MEKPGFELGALAILSLVLSHMLSTAGLTVTTLIVWLRIDTSHPVFAIVWQEVLFQLALSLVSFVSLLPLCNDYLLVWYKLTTVITVVSVSFHQVSWLAITHLRYLLMVKMTPTEVESADLTSLRRYFKKIVPFGTVLFLIVCAMFWAAMLAPQKRLAEDVEPTIRFYTRMGTFGFLNLPDYASLAYYARLWWHFKDTMHASNLVAPVENEPSGQGNAPGPSNVEGHLDQQEPFVSLVRQRTVMRTLRVHVALALADLLIMPPAALFEERSCQFFYLAHCNAVVAFWLPLLVITRDFNQINGVNLREVLKEMCGIWV